MVTIQRNGAKWIIQVGDLKLCDALCGNDTHYNGTSTTCLR